jgi:hypothetical protein
MVCVCSDRMGDCFERRKDSRKDMICKDLRYEMNWDRDYFSPVEKWSRDCPELNSGMTLLRSQRQAPTKDR